MHALKDLHLKDRNTGPQVPQDLGLQKPFTGIRRWGQTEDRKLHLSTQARTASPRRQVDLLPPPTVAHRSHSPDVHFHKKLQVFFKGKGPIYYVK